MNTTHMLLPKTNNRDGNKGYDGTGMEVGWNWDGSRMEMGSRMELGWN